MSGEKEAFAGKSGVIARVQGRILRERQPVAISSVAPYEIATGFTARFPTQNPRNDAFWHYLSRLTSAHSFNP
jgi:hypothetical protein